VIEERDPSAIPKGVGVKISTARAAIFKWVTPLNHLQLNAYG